MHCNQCPFLHQVSSAKRSFAFISGSASLSNSKRAVMEMVGSPAAADNSNVHCALFCPDAHPQKALPRQTAQSMPLKVYLTQFSNQYIIGSETNHRKGWFPMARRYDSKEAKRRILTACVRLFLEKGYTNTKVAEILKEADVSAGSFQNIFRTKDGVLQKSA